VIAGYEGSNTSQVVLKGEGEGGFAEFQAKLGDEVGGLGASAATNAICIRALS
jgi:hypothetical protein